MPLFSIIVKNYRHRTRHRTGKLRQYSISTKRELLCNNSGESHDARQVLTQAQMMTAMRKSNRQLFMDSQLCPFRVPLDEAGMIGVQANRLFRFRKLI